MHTTVIRRPVEIFRTASGIEYSVVALNQRVSLHIPEDQLHDRLGQVDPMKRREVEEHFLGNERSRHDTHTGLVLKGEQAVPLAGRHWLCIDLEVTPYGRER